MSDADDTRPGTPRAKLSTHNRLQVRELVRTWIEMAPRLRRVRVEFDKGVMWAIVTEDGFVARAPLDDSEDVWLAWGRAMNDLAKMKRGD